MCLARNHLTIKTSHYRQYQSLNHRNQRYSSLNTKPITKRKKLNKRYKVQNSVFVSRKQILITFYLKTGAYESDSFKGSNDNLASTIGTAISGFQNQGEAAFNSFAGQANGFINNVGSAVAAQFSSGTKPTSVAQTQNANDEQQEFAGASENLVSANLVETQPPEQSAPQQSAPQQPEQQQPEQQQPEQQLQQQNEVHEEYLPPRQ